MNIETQSYFNGPQEEVVPTFSPEEYIATLGEKPLGELEDLELTLKEEIDTDKENELKKRNAPRQGIDQETLPFKIQKAEELHTLHEQQLEILKQIKKSKQKSVRGSSGFRTFLNF